MGKKIKDKNAPKRPMTAYFIWLGENREELVKDLPKGAAASAIGKKAGAIWQTMSDEAKAPFQKKSEGNKAGYKEKLAEYQQSDNYKKHQELEKARKDKLKKSRKPEKKVKKKIIKKSKKIIKKSKKIIRMIFRN